MISSIFFYYHAIVLGDVFSYLEATFIGNNKQQRLLILIYWPLSAPALNSHKLLLCLFTKKTERTSAPVHSKEPAPWLDGFWMKVCKATAGNSKVNKSRLYTTVLLCWLQSGSFYGGNNLHLSTAVMFVALERDLLPCHPSSRAFT